MHGTAHNVSLVIFYISIGSMIYTQDLFSIYVCVCVRVCVRACVEPKLAKYHYSFPTVISLQGRTACMQILGLGFRCSSFWVLGILEINNNISGSYRDPDVATGSCDCITLMRPNGGRPVRCVLPPCQGIDYHAILIYHTMLLCLQRTLRILHGFYPLDHAKILNLIS